MWYIIVNPVANNGKAKKVVPRIEAAFKNADLEYKLVMSEYKWHCAELAQEAVENGYHKIVAVGGDGTGHEVINGIFNQDSVPTSEVTFTVIPFGTGNDWVKTYKIPNHIEKVVDLLKKEKTRFQDMGLVRFKDDKGHPAERYFFNVAGFGYDAYITRTSNIERGYKFSTGLYYYSLIFRCLFQYKPKTARLILDDKNVDNTYYTINVGLCKYSGGGMQFTPHALPDDSLFAISSVEKMSKLRVLFSTQYLYGNIHNHPKGHLYKARKVQVEALKEGETMLELDGEYVGTTPCEFTLLDKALKVVIP
jgi:YegS/Rv2252/BmrU family lipid kinase